MSKEKGLPYNNLELVTNTKEHFTILCAMYEQMGLYFKQQVKILQHPLFARCSIHQIQERLLNQYHEAGEELKTMGTHLDLMGGKPVMKAAEPEKKEEEKKEESKSEKRRKKISKKTFVSNIQPTEKKKEEEK